MNWISVDERLPENMNEVLMLDIWEDVPCVGYYRASDKKWIANQSYLDGEYFYTANHVKIAFWMPLPEKPTI